MLDALTRTVEQARSMPMSASCVVNRAEVLGLLDELRARLPQALREAEHVLGDRAGVVDDGRREAERVVATAQAERRRLVGGSDVVRDAEAEARQVLARASEQAQALREQAEDWVDTRLATFEVVLTKTLAAVERGRDQLAGGHPLDALRDDGPDDPDDRPLFS